MLLVTTWFGTFLVDEGKVVEKRLFPRDPEALAERLALVEDWKVLPEERELMAAHPDAFVSEPRLERAGGAMTSARAEFLRPEDFGYDRALLHAAMLSLARRQMRKAVGPDDHLHQAVGALDDLQETENLLLERLREWYGLHFPELAKTVDDAEFVGLIAAHGTREAMPLPATESVGAPLGLPERRSVMEIATLVRDLSGRRREIEGYVEASASRLAPNVSALAGPVLAARLVSLAGGVEALARLPASTVQLLGAERALFRHLREHTRPPKHGVLFQHPLVHRAPPWQRGAIARAFAGKIAIAARADAYSRRDIAASLKAQFDRALTSIRETKRAPPARKEERRRPGKGRRKGNGGKRRR
jgi:nucleolar protein 56